MPRLADTAWTCKRTDTYEGIGFVTTLRGKRYEAERVAVTLVRSNVTPSWRISLVVIHGVTSTPAGVKRRINTQYTHQDIARGVQIPPFAQELMRRSLGCAEL